MMKKSYLLGAALMALTWTSCTQDDSLNLVADDSVFTGEMEYVGSRTSLSEDNKISWVMEDELSIFKKNTINRHYKVSSINNGKATFTYLDNETPDPVASIPANYAVYPYSEDNTITSAGVISAPIEDKYEYENRTSFISSALMASTSDGTNFSFKNVQGYLRLRLCAVIPEDYESAVKSVTLTSTKALSGTAAITFGTDGIPTAEIKENAGYSLTVDLKTPQRLATKASGNYVELYVPVVPMTFGAGEITLTINFEEGDPFSKANGKAITIARREVTGMMLEIGADEGFTGDIESADEAAEVSTAEELAALLTSNKDEISVKLENDIDLPISSLGTITGGSGEYKLGGENTQNITIDLNGKNLNVTTTYWSVLGAKNADALFTIKNGTMTSSQASGTWNSYDLGFANCNYVIENVIFDKAIALEGANKEYTLKNVTINETHDYYAIWISAKGQNVTIDGLTINSSGRGIKIDEQYVGNPAKVTLNINNATFKTAKKAAILVKSVAGAEIKASNLDISEVTEDKGFAVWVDEDAKDYADFVVVNGAQVKVEGDNTKVTVESNNDLTQAINAGATTINLVSGNYTLPAIKNNVAISGSRDVVITIDKPNMSGKDLTLQGVTVKGLGYSTGVQHVNSVTYNNVKIIGEMCLYGENVVFNKCEFELNNQYVWTYGAKNAEFNNCVFNTNGKAILVYNEGAGTNNVKVNGCTFNATAGAKAGAIANQNCAAIEIDNFQSSGTGAAHKVTTSGNTFDSNFSGEWRIKNYVNGNSITVNGVEYTSIALDGKTMTIDANKNVTVNE